MKITLKKETKIKTDNEWVKRYIPLHLNFKEEDKMGFLESLRKPKRCKWCGNVITKEQDKDFKGCCTQEHQRRQGMSSNFLK